MLQPLRFEDYLSAAFGQMRSYVATDPNARTRALATLAGLADSASNEQRRALIEAERARLTEMVIDAIA